MKSNYDALCIRYVEADCMKKSKNRARKNLIWGLRPLKRIIDELSRTNRDWKSLRANLQNEWLPIVTDVRRILINEANSRPLGDAFRALVNNHLPRDAWFVDRIAWKIVDTINGRAIPLDHSVPLPIILEYLKEKDTWHTVFPKEKSRFGPIEPIQSPPSCRVGMYGKQ